MATLATIPKYDAYRDSGFNWIGKVPNDWEVTKLGVCLSPVSIKNRPDFPLLSITRELGVIERDIGNQESNHNFIPDDLSGYKLLKQGQFGMNKMKAWQGSYGVSKYTGIVSPAYYVFDFVKSIEPSFFNLAIRSKLYVTYFGSASDGVRIGQWDLSKDRMKVIPFILPSPSEQTSIANYLDKKTAQIEEAITIKEKLIALLKERKKIIIQKAVTQGLHLNMPMKDAGVDWIGHIPEHWEVLRAKYLFKEIDERSIDGNEELLSVSHLTGVTPRSEKSVTMIAEDYTGSKTCQENDLIMNIMWAWMGALGVSDRVGIVSSAYSIYRQLSLHTFNPIYLEWLLKTTGYIEHYNKVSTGLHSSRLRFYSRMFFDMEIGFPNRKEQNQIVEHVENQSLKIDNAIELQGLQIKKLKEYKATLINSAVTGKIKVV